MIKTARNKKFKVKNPIVNGKFKINKLKKHVLEEIEFYKRDNRDYEIYKTYGFYMMLGFYNDLLDKLDKLKNDDDLKNFSNYLEDVKDHSVLLLKKIWEK